MTVALLLPRLRISLGLKPLNMEKKGDDKAAAHAAHAAKTADAERRAEATELAERIKS
jgi:hypothetical protein